MVVYEHRGVSLQRVGIRFSEREYVMMCMLQRACQRNRGEEREGGRERRRGRGLRGMCVKRARKGDPKNMPLWRVIWREIFRPMIGVVLRHHVDVTTGVFVHYIAPPCGCHHRGFCSRALDNEV